MGFTARLGGRRSGARRSDSRGRSSARLLGRTLVFAALVGIGGAIAAPGSAQAQQTAPATLGAPSEAGEAGEASETPSVLAQFTTGIENREPIDQITFVGNDARKVFFFTDLRGLEGRTVVHRWIYDGRVMAEVEFEVRGPRWRVWSSKDLLPDWIGDWTVEVVVRPDVEDGEADGEGTDEGEVIAAESFTYSAPEA
jgi:hypothetical protein